MLQNCFDKVLKFWAMYYYYELNYYYYQLVLSNNHLLKLFYEIKWKKKIGQTYRPKKSAFNIGHRLPWFLNIGIGQRKTLIGRHLLQTLKFVVLPLLHLLMYFECDGHFIFFSKNGCLFVMHVRYATVCLLKTSFVITNSSIPDLWHWWKFRFGPLNVDFENPCSRMTNTFIKSPCHQIILKNCLYILSPSSCHVYCLGI